MRIAIINGPNLNLLGIREPEIYGNQGFEAYLNEISELFQDLKFHYFQSNVEGEIINEIQRCGLDPEFNGIVINAGGYSHTSVAIADALRSVPISAVSVHISNIHNREDYRQRDLCAAACAGCISGLGLKGYTYAIQYFIDQSES